MKFALFLIASVFLRDTTARKLCFSVTSRSQYKLRADCLTLYDELMTAKKECSVAKKDNFSEAYIQHVCAEKTTLFVGWLDMKKKINSQNEVVPKNHPCTIYSRKLDQVKCMNTQRSIPDLREACRERRRQGDAMGSAECKNYAKALASIPKKKRDNGSCPTNHYYENGVCQPNLCTCSGGEEVPSHKCPSHASNHCLKCDSGFLLGKDRSCMRTADLDGEDEEHSASSVARVEEPEPITAAPTTAEPTTAEPTTAEPTTAEPTTAEPTTAEPTTAEPTTAEPTTAEPTTAEPTTAEPTTAEPTTAEPTTAEPTTAEPTTAEPTTAEPTTAEPTTAEPTTAEPTTVEPTTAEPTTAEPTTAEPTTAEPTTAEPTTAEPTTAEPTTAEPTTAEPTTAEPTTAEPTTTEATTVAATTIAATTVMATTTNYQETTTYQDTTTYLDTTTLEATTAPILVDSSEVEPEGACVRYHVSTQKESWNQDYCSLLGGEFCGGQQYCERIGMTMATIRSQAEYAFLDAYLATQSAVQWGITVFKREPFWIAGSRKTLLRDEANSGEHLEWVWHGDENDPITCKKWGKGLPNNGYVLDDHTYDEDCLTMKPKKYKGCTETKCTGGGPYVWNDEYCSMQLRVVCEDRTCVPNADCS